MRVNDELVLHAGTYEDASGCPSCLPGPFAAILKDPGHSLPMPELNP